MNTTVKNDFYTAWDQSKKLFICWQTILIVHGCLSDELCASQGIDFIYPFSRVLKDKGEEGHSLYNPLDK